jgi:hypothetical protein
MRRLSIAFTFITVALAAPVGHGSAATPTPVLVELFTAEGCSSCPPADALLQSLADSQPIEGVQIVALGHHVDYWDQLGWRDRFSSTAATNRQQRYSQVLNVDSVYTPEMVVDGREQFVSSDARAARRAIGKAASVAHARVTFSVEPSEGDRVAVAVTVNDLPAVSRGDHADVVVAVVESRLQTEVKGGENRGRVLAHAPVVRQMTTIGEATTPRLTAGIPIARGWQREHITMVAFVQERFSRHVLGAAAVPLATSPASRPGPFGPGGIR